MVVLLAFAATPHVLLPAGQIEQARVVAEGKPALGLPAALVGQANLAGVVVLSGATPDQAALGGRPEAGAIVDVGQFVQHGGEHFPAHGAVGAVGLQGGG